MKLKSPVIAAALVALLSLTACGGGGGSSSGSTGGSTGGSTVADNPGSFSQTDVVQGTGAQAGAGNVVGVRYTGWLYSASAADHKGTQFDSNLTAATPFVFTFGTNAVISGFEQGVTGMKVGGKRTLIIPASMAYGATGSGSIPANAGVVFDIQLTDAQAVAEAPGFSTTDTMLGTGATAAAGTTVSVKYSEYLYSAAATDHKGILVDTNTAATTALSFKLGASPLQVIAGLDQGVTGMKVGGKRTIVMPSSQAYGATGYGTVPAKSGIVFDVEVTADQ